MIERIFVKICGLSDHQKNSEVNPKIEIDFSVVGKLTNWILNYPNKL